MIGMLGGKKKLSTMLYVISYRLSTRILSYQPTVVVDKIWKLTNVVRVSSSLLTDTDADALARVSCRQIVVQKYKY